jgi:mRNA interferase MazF
MARAVRRGEVRWFRFQAPDKQRPVVILTRESVLDYLGEVTIAPITSTVREIPSEVMLGTGDGMARECAVNLDHVQTVARGRIGALITTLSARRMTEIRTALLFALGY